MCGRCYSITVDKNTIEYHFNAKFVTGQQEFQPTYNAAPSQLLTIITTSKGQWCRCLCSTIGSSTALGGT